MQYNENAASVIKLMLLGDVVRLDYVQKNTPVRELMKSDRKADNLISSWLNHAVGDVSGLKAVVDFLREEGFLNEIFTHENVFIMALLRAAADYQQFQRWAERQELMAATEAA